MFIKLSNITGELANSQRNYKENVKSTFEYDINY